MKFFLIQTAILMLCICTSTVAQDLGVDGNARLGGLSGTGTRMVVADPNGNLDTQSIPAGGGSVWSLSGSDAYYNDGEVGIGTTNPGQPLDVYGDVIVGGSSSNYDANSEVLQIRGRSDDWFLGVQNETTAGASDFFIGLGFNEDGIFHLQQSNGFLGLGTTAPDEKLHLHDGSTDGARLKITHSTSGTGASDGLTITSNQNNAHFNNYENGAMHFWNNGANRMIIDPDGNVGIGTISPEAGLHLHNAGSDISYIQIANSISGAGTQDGLQIYSDNENAYVTNYESGFLNLGTNGGIGITVDANGHLGIKTDDPLLELDIHERISGGNYQIELENPFSNGNRWQLGSASTGTFRIKEAFAANYAYLNPNSSTWNLGSDARIKENITDMEDVLDKVMALKLKDYNYIGQTEPTIGLLAQEEEPLFPDLVHTEPIHPKSEDYGVYQALGMSDIKSLDYTLFTFVALKAIQEQQRTMDILEVKNEELSLENGALKEEVDRLQSETRNQAMENRSQSAKIQQLEDEMAELRQFITRFDTDLQSCCFSSSHDINDKWENDAYQVRLQCILVFKINIYLLRFVYHQNFGKGLDA